MRRLAAVAILMLAACSDGGTTEGAGEAKGKAEAARNLQLAAGQWETVTEVTSFAQADQGTPAINTPQGTRTTASHCVAEGEGKQPPATLLAGSEDYSCTYGNHYMSAGSLNSQLECKRSGVTGQVMMSVDGSYTADTIEANQSLTTYLPGTGDVKITSKMTGRRTGECTPDAAGNEPAKAG